jgi:hypothetical protein
VADLKPVYLVCGDDDVKIDAWRARVKARAEQESGQGSLEQHDGASMPPDASKAGRRRSSIRSSTRWPTCRPRRSWS